MTGIGRGLGFGRAADDYERGRPAWPPEAVDRATQVLELSADVCVLDLAAGTGKLTRLLTPRFARVIAVEPDAAMRALLSQATTWYLVLEGTAEAIPLTDGAVDAVFVADAFHWFATEVAVAEIRRVLRPHGGVAVLRSPWSRDSFEPAIPADLLAELDAAYARAEAGTSWGPHYATDAWFELFERGGFETPRTESFANAVVLDAEQVASLWLSVSTVTMLPGREHGALGRKLRAGLDGTYQLSFETDLYWTRPSK